MSRVFPSARVSCPKMILALSFLQVVLAFRIFGFVSDFMKNSASCTTERSVTCWLPLGALKTILSSAMASLALAMGAISMKIMRLSFFLSGTSKNSVPAFPSTLMRYGEELPPSNVIFGIRTSLFSLL